VEYLHTLYDQDPIKFHERKYIPESKVNFNIISG